MSGVLYVKTDKGRLEIETRASGLSAKLRRILILIDGHRSMDDLMAQTGLSMDADALLAELDAQGFIVRVGPPPGQEEPAAALPDDPEELLVSLEDMVAMRKLMLESAQRFLGPTGGAVVRQLRVANSEEKLAACVQPWHLALKNAPEAALLADGLHREVCLVLRLKDE